MEKFFKLYVIYMSEILPNEQRYFRSKILCKYIKLISEINHLNHWKT